MTIHSASADLHIHTTYSDGYHSPQEIIEKAKNLGLRAIAITDHDNVMAIRKAKEFGKSAGVEVLSGIELSVSYKNYDLHLLGYCFDETNADLVSSLKLFNEERTKRAEKIVQKLAKLGMPISFNAVLEKAGHGTVGRPHIANVLIEDQFVYSFQEAFNRYLGTGKPANVDKYNLKIDDAIRLIKKAGGICSVAHPGIQLQNDDLIQLIKNGVQGIEVVHPKHSQEATQYYRKLVEENNLLETGGSDFHGGHNGNESLGKYNIPYSDVIKMKEVSRT